jgi:cell wall-associated NlpC family hydrolase
MALTGRRSLPAGPAARRSRRAAVAVTVLALLVPLGPSAIADNGPVFPSQAQVDASKGAVSAKADRVGTLEAQLAAASVRADRLATEAAQAVEAYNGARFRLDQAVKAALDAQQAAQQAQQQVTVARAALGRFAADAYRSGGDLSGLATFLVAEGPRDLISRASALQSIGNSRQHALENLRSSEAYAAVLDHRAASLVEQRQRAARQVELAKTAAEARLATQRQAVGQIAAQRETWVRALAAARHTSVQLERARQTGLEQARVEAARKAAEARAAAAARRAEAARVAAAARAAENARQAAAEQRAADEKRAADQRAADAAKSTPDPAPSNPPSSSGGGGGGGGGSSGGGGGGGSSDGTSSGAEMAIAYARAQIGKPYQWAADGPSSFDCSGLTMRAWQQGGVSLPHYTVAQYQQAQKVALSDLRRGDLVFFASNSDYHSIYHVGLYIGAGQMIEAPYTGENVRISSIWRSSLFGAARP